MKVVVSGYGVISGIGKDIGETLKNFSPAEIEPEAVTVFDSELKNPVFEVKEWPAEKYSTGQRSASLLFHALGEALTSAGLKRDLKKYRIGICIGTTVACQLNDIGFYENYKKNGLIDNNSLNRYLNGNLAELIKVRYGLSGPALTVVNACTSGADAIGTASLWIKSGLCDIAIAGGADEINKVPLAGFASLNNMSEERCRPFDKNRAGLNVGEGSGVVILETEDHIKKRNCHSDIVLSGYSTATDAYHLTAPSPEGTGLKKAVRNSMKEASVTGDEIAFVNAHGTATRDNDLIEGQVIGELIGKKIKFLSTKGYTGHTLGAAGGIEAVFTILGLKKKWIPKSHGFRDFDEEIGISPVTERTEIEKNAAMSTSLAFGGNNTVLIFKRQEN
ncbi:MAG: beta-ketoacyl-[acyl-carrier-protein] synthase family protein [Victivallales bacterium]|nr:beta-ketoacyl-[acyl-carrier-protein] synthase family protein [Victivallales bacterium]